MKKVFLFTGLSVVSFLVITSFIKKQSLVTDYLSAGKTVFCPVPVPAVASSAFVPSYSPAAVMIRKNIYSYSAADIASLKAGINAMKALPVTDVTSWQYQAAIHGTTLTNNLPLWNSCQHYTPFFYSWHRMYLYFFERILRAKSGNPNLTLPYWDYQTNAVLPPDYRNSAAGNPLYDGSRNGSINAGGALSSSIMTSFNNSLTDIPFYDFQNDIQGPHGSVHVAIGGNMGSVPTAALDPCFWLHHTNIDRLWEVWLRKCGGRSDPKTDTSWMNKQFTFYNETGAAVVMTGSQVVSTAASLNYRYDLPLKFRCGIIIKWWLWYWKWWELMRLPHPIIINQQIAKVSFRDTPTDSLKIFMQQTKTASFNFSLTDIPDKLYIQLEDIKIEKMPEGVVEVYLNLKPGEVPKSSSPSFAGVLDLFAVSAHNHNAENNNNLRLNISTAARNLGLKVADLRAAEFTFYVRGNTLKGREIKTEAAIQAGSVVIGVEKAGKQR